MQYVSIPKELPFSEIRASEACFAPGRYVRFIPPKAASGIHFVPLDKLIFLRDSRIATKKNKIYRYAEIGDIDVGTGGIVFRSMVGYRLPTNRPLIAKNGDIIVSTVRTYRKGIGCVADDGEDLVTTNAVLNICGVTDFAPNLTMLYVYSFLRTDFFVEQVWSMLNRGLYPRMDKGALDKILIPIAEDKRVIRYVSAITQAIIEKDKAIRERHDAITSTIEEELSTNNRGKAFHYAFPVISEIKESSRFDSGLYCTGFRSFKHRVDGYKRGTTCLSKMGVRTRRGPNLAVSVIGRSLYSEEPKPGWYQLIRPVNISKYGTLAQREWLGIKKTLPLVQQGDLIMGCEGFQKGRTIVMVDHIERCTTNFHGTVIYWPDSELWQIIFLRCFLTFLREYGVIDWVGVGGSGGHMSPDYFDYLPIPKFPEDKQGEIARLYHHTAPPPPVKPTLDTFVDWHRRWNAGLGIWELDREMKALQRTLFEVQEQIIEGKMVNVPIEGAYRDSNGMGDGVGPS